MPQWPTIPQGLPKILRPLFLILKPIIQFLTLLWYLGVKIPAPDAFIVQTCIGFYKCISPLFLQTVEIYMDLYMVMCSLLLLQNPPSVLTLADVKWASWVRRSAFIVDWQNFCYTLLTLSLGRSSSFVSIYHWTEKHYGKMAYGSLCVTKAMQHELSQNWGIKATILYDQPPDFFRPASLEEKHSLFCRINKSLNEPYGLRDCVSNGLTGSHNNDPNDTPFTTRVGADIFLKQSRPALIVSNEDFGILLEAALMYDRRVAALFSDDESTGDEVVWDSIRDGKQFLYPRLLFIITGKGPEKEKYKRKIRKLSLK
ncbi:Chitobiosyldiphosphodolichol beta-mannosyltransferase [Handroanthus impetiginosus]|uniref:Chitobiosyldiphosphodolichol beta-mannosyltransferase n=1 Tax=Handroanthus impetiginosus TaxID=429701 RepID=A0A2G9H3A8_9LAMI|nr:Chitobiosyldiphosphodolichol beta-mannosyltransferase [Handroanthus impetiginosus]